MNKTNVFVASVAVLTIAGSSFFGYMNHNVTKERNALAEQTVQTKQQLLEASNEEDRLKDIGTDKRLMTQQMTGRMVSAKNIANELLSLDQSMVTYYHGGSINRNTSEKKKRALLKNMQNVWARYEKITGSSDRSPNIAFRKNPKWTMTLKSVLPYKESPEVPLLFEMRTKKGKLAGMVVATYYVENQQIRHIKRYYTSEGQRDFVDVGGD